MTMFFQVLLGLVKYDLLSTTQVKSVLARTAQPSRLSRVLLTSEQPKRYQVASRFAPVFAKKNYYYLKKKKMTQSIRESAGQINHSINQSVHQAVKHLISQPLSYSASLLSCIHVSNKITFMHQTRMKLSINQSINSH